MQAACRLQVYFAVLLFGVHLTNNWRPRILFPTVCSVYQYHDDRLEI